MIDTNMDSPSQTPTTSPPKKTIRMTQVQKQALMDNLQLEITERARKLRAQYAQQAASLRSRLEIRLHRIPTSLRKANMGELLAKYNAMLENKKDATSTTMPAPTKKIEDKPAIKTTSSSPAQTRGMKRKSDHLDKENIPTATAPYAALPNPKKRTKPNPAVAHPPATTATPAPQAKRTISRTAPTRTKPPPPPTAAAPATRTASRALARATSRSKAPPPPPSTILSPKPSNVQPPAPAPAPAVKRGKAAAAPAPKKVQAPPSAPVKAVGKKGAPRAQVEAPAGGRRVLRTRK